MHGRRILDEKNRSEEEREALKLKAKKYANLCNIALLKYKSKDYSMENIELTSSLLRINPDFYSMWNYRRHMLIHHYQDKYGLQQELSTIEEGRLSKLDTTSNTSDSDIIKQIANTEFDLTKDAIMKNPKSYCAWYHRQWIVQRFQYSTDGELSLCNKLLSIDGRNFHCWNYRSFIIADSKVGINQELEFTSQKITENFSNYSAFHCRSHLIKHIIEEGENVSVNKDEKEKIEYNKNNENDIVSIRNRVEQEVEIIENAVFTEPDDQSPWWYLRFLIQCSLTAYQKIKTDNDNNNSDSDNLNTDGSASFGVWLEYLLTKLINSIEELLEEEGGLMSNDGGRWCKLALVELYTSRYTLLHPNANSDYERLQVILDALIHTDPKHKVRYQYLLQYTSLSQQKSS